MKKIVSQGVPKGKLHIGIPLYGQSFTLKSTSSNQLGAPTRGGGEPGEFTLQRGMLAYHEICSKVNDEKNNALILIDGEEGCGFEDDPEDLYSVEGEGYNLQYIGMVECFDEGELENCQRHFTSIDEIKRLPEENFFFELNNAAFEFNGSEELKSQLYSLSTIEEIQYSMRRFIPSYIETIPNVSIVHNISVGEKCGKIFELLVKCG